MLPELGVTDERAGDVLQVGICDHAEHDLSPAALVRLLVRVSVARAEPSRKVGFPLRLRCSSMIGSTSALDCADAQCQL